MPIGRNLDSFLALSLLCLVGIIWDVAEGGILTTEQWFPVSTRGTCGLIADATSKLHCDQYV